MFEPLGMPAFLADRSGKTARSPAFEICIFFVLTLVAQLVQSVLLTPIQFFYTITDEAYYEVATSGDVAAILEFSKQLAEKITHSPLYQVCMLLSTVAIIAAVILYCRAFQKRSLFSLGITRKPFKEYAVGFFLGALALAVAVGFSFAFGSVSYAGPSSQRNILLATALLVGYIVQGFSEEILCRGYLMTALGRKMPLWMAIVASSFAFAAIHMGNIGYSLLGFLNVFLFGVLLALYMIRRGSIWGAAALHAAWNFAEGVFGGFGVSGIPSVTSFLSFSLREGDEIIHGGAFGLEGGLATTCILSVGIALLLMMKTKASASATPKTEESK